MRDNVLSEFSQRFRDVSVRLLARNEKLVWTRDAFVEQLASGTPITFTTSSMAYSASLQKFVRYGIKTGTNDIYTNTVTPAKVYNAPCNWTLYANMPGTGITANYTDVSSDGNSVLCADTGKVYRRVGTTWSLMRDMTDTANGIVPYISITSMGDGLGLYAVAAVYASANGGVNDHCDLWYFNASSGGSVQWPGYLPKVSKKVNIAAVYHQAIAYIYVDDGSGKHPVYIKRYFTDGSWSASRQILPTGMEDDDNSFTVGHAGLINGFPFLTGVIRRKNGGTYAVLMSGPEDFTYGRDLILSASDARRYDVCEIEGVLYALADGMSAWADNLGPFQSPTTESTPHANIPTDYYLETSGLQMQTGLNAPDRLSFQLDPAQIEGRNIDVNTNVYVEVSSAGNPYILGRFGVDRIRKEEIDSGNVYSLDCTSWALKKMIDWQSDTYIDYMGQSEAHGDPSDLAKLTRASGHFDKGASGGAVMTEFNQDGIMYANLSASHGGWMSCLFTNMVYASPDVIVGVGLNYGQESLATAAARLNKKLVDVKATDRMTYGIFAVYIPYWKATQTGRICLYSYNTARTDGRDHPWLLIKDVPWEYGGTKHRIALNYQDGYARVYADTNDTDPVYELVLSAPVSFRDTMPTEHINYGRGAVFMRLDTGFQAALPFTTESDVVPFYDETAEGLAYDLPMTGICNWKFPASNGVVLVDSEQIKYTGIAGFEANGVTPRSTQDLWIVPGKIVKKSMNVPLTTPTGPALTFGFNRQTNYLVQDFTVTEEHVLTALRVWIQKVNYPEDGIEVRIAEGSTVRAGWDGKPADDAHPYGKIISQGNYLPSGQLKAAGSWVLVPLTDPCVVEAGKHYRFIICRSKNASHPDATTYFATKLVNATAGQGLYLFAEEDWKYHAERPGKLTEDWLYPQNGIMPFQLYASLEDAGGQYSVAVQYEAGKGLPTAGASTFHTNMAFCGTAGGGKGTSTKIVKSRRFTDSLNDLYVFDLDRDPGRIWDADSKGRATMAFYGLTRGYASTTATAHGDLVKIHRYSAAAKTVTAAYFEYFSANEDLTLAEVAREIARKAQVPEVILANRHTGTLTWGANTEANGYWPIVANTGSNNLIAVTTLSRALYPNQRLDFEFKNVPANTYPVRVVLECTAANVNILTVTSIADKATVVTHDFFVNLQIPIAGEIRVELFSGYVSVWIGGRLVGACVTDNTFKDTAHTWTTFVLRAVDFAAVRRTEPTIAVLVPEAGTRVDSFVMDQGKSGTQLLTSLIGEKRIYFREDRWGRLRIFTERPAVPTPIYDRAVALQSETSDQGLATRILLEGGEVVEVSNAGNLVNYGNLFKSINFNEINNLEDARYFANMIIGDMQLNLKPLQFTGPADPLYEPGDKMKVYSRGSVVRPLVVDSITYDLHTDQAEAVFDMQVIGRETSAF